MICPRFCAGSGVSAEHRKRIILKSPGPVSLLCTIRQGSSCTGKKKRACSYTLCFKQSPWPWRWPEILERTFGPKFWAIYIYFFWGGGAKFGFGPEQVLIILGRPEPEARFDSRTGIRNDNLDNNYLVSDNGPAGHGPHMAGHHGVWAGQTKMAK